jgi:hypothetical protein
MGAWCLVLCSLVVVSLGPVFQGVGSGIHDWKVLNPTSPYRRSTGRLC